MSSAVPASADLGRGPYMAFIAVVVAGYASLLGSLSQFAPWELVALVLLGVAYVAAGVAGDEFCRRQFPGAGRLVYFSFQIILGAAIVYLGRAGFISLVLFPLASQAASCLSLRWTAVVCAVIAAAMALPVAYYYGSQAALQSLLSLGAGLLFVVVFTQVTVSEQRSRTEAQRLAAELAETNRQLREYAVQVEELAVTTERNRMAREIHDTLGHYLTAVNMQIQAARAVLPSHPDRAQDALSKAQGLTREGLADVRRSVAALRGSPTGDRPLVEALVALVGESEAAGVASKLEIQGEPRQLAPAVELTLYRAVQEGLTNVRKHAGSARAAVSIDFRAGDVVRLSVSDDGRGAQPGGQGFGLMGVRERARLLGGSASIESVPGQGFTLALVLPVRAADGGGGSVEAMQRGAPGS